MRGRCFVWIWVGLFGTLISRWGESPCRQPAWGVGPSVSPGYGPVHPGPGPRPEFRRDAGQTRFYGYPGYHDAEIPGVMGYPGY